MFDFIIGAGQGGARIAKVFSEVFTIDKVEAPVCYMNLTSIDFSKFDVPLTETFILEEGGTGRNVEFGEAIVRGSLDKLATFLNGRSGYIDSKYVLVCIGGGGGSGTGFMYPLLDILLKAKKIILLAYTFPELREGIPTKPNALFGLNRLIEEYSSNIAILPISNEYCVKTYGHTPSFSYWDKVNIGIVKSLKRFWNVTTLEDRKNYIDFTSGYKALDKNDIRRVVFAVGGFLDLREIHFDNIIAGDIPKSLKRASVVFDGLDLRTAKRYAVSVGIPDSWKGHTAGIKAVLTFIEDVFKGTHIATKSVPDVTRSSYFNKKIVKAKLSLLATGITANAVGLNDIVKSAEKDMDKLNSRLDITTLDLKKLIY